MSNTFFTANSIGSGVRFASSTVNSDVIVAQGVLVGSLDTRAIDLTSSDHDVIVQGTVIGGSGSYGVNLGGTSTAGNNLVVTSDGYVEGASLSGSGSVLNSGTIRGYINALQFFLADGEVINVANHGLIAAGSQALRMSATAASSVQLTNHGAIEGGIDAYSGGDGADRITNRGTMQGDVRLFGGADLFDNRGGTIEGAVFGDAGADTFLPGDGAEDFDGGAGFDTLDFRGGAGVTASLRDDAGTGRAEGDVYLGFERVIGSQGSADTLLGDDAANVLVGLGGGDILQGGGGSDRLNGAAGVDRLRGGAGSDTFVYSDAFAGGDLILDYGNVAGNNDTVALLAAGFGAGLAAGALAATRFRARADNLAQDADDRFVFRTADATLWFDANGSGAGGLTLLADLQAGASLTAADILLV